MEAEGYYIEICDRESYYNPVGKYGYFYRNTFDNLTEFDLWNDIGTLAVL